MAFVNTGEMNGVQLNIEGGEAILAGGNSTFNLDPGDSLVVASSSAHVGFDGTDDELAMLNLFEGSSISFIADEGGFGEICEFGSEVFGTENGNVTSAIDLGNSALQIELAGFVR